MTQCKHITRSIVATLLFFPVFSQAQVPVDDDGNVIGSVAPGADVMALGDDGIPRLNDLELQELVGPVALYPDDLLAVVLPASAYPLQIAAAARFLEEREHDPTLEPDPDWDDSVVALLNYPEVVELLNEDLDWTYRLGEAVVAQQTDVIAAVESFRDRAYAAGNLKSDEYQTVARNDGALHITPVADDAIYVPYYEPARVVTYQTRPAYYYYPRPCPVYYYPYASGYRFNRGYFWGVTTAFSIGWYSDSLNVWHHSYRGHPYFGYRYRSNDWWYRRPTINVYNTTYVDNTVVTVNRYNRGDRWRARQDRREYIRREGYSQDRYAPVRRSMNTNTPQRVVNTRSNRTRANEAEPIRFRERPARTDRTANVGTRRTQSDRVAATDSRRVVTSRRADIESRRDRNAASRDVARSRSDARRPNARATQRETRAVPQRSGRSTPQREARSVPQRESRSVPQRESRSAPQRERRTAPARQSRQASAAPRQAERASGGRRAPDERRSRSSKR